MFIYFKLDKLLAISLDKLLIGLSTDFFTVTLSLGMVQNIDWTIGLDSRPRRLTGLLDHTVAFWTGL